MAALGATWAQHTRGTILSAPTHLLNASASVWVHVAAMFGAFVAAYATAWLTIRATRVLVAHTHWARQLHQALRSQLHGASPSQMVLVACLSACSEELLFRAALGPSIGVVAASGLFGLAHLPGGDSGPPRAACAFMMGLLLSGLYLASGTLLAPILAHAVINYENMQYICNYDPTPLDIDRFAVGREYDSDR
jgi:uncharacterized protein